MDVDGRWQKAFQIGTKCCITLAEEMSQHAPVDIMVVPGNHDREKAFVMGEVLGARFHGNHSINVLNDPNLMSYYRFGKVLLGFVHGDNRRASAEAREQGFEGGAVQIRWVYGKPKKAIAGMPGAKAGAMEVRGYEIGSDGAHECSAVESEPGGHSADQAKKDVRGVACVAHDRSEPDDGQSTQKTHGDQGVRGYE